MKYAMDFAALFILYAAVFFRRWRAKGRDVLFINSVFYLYLSFVLYFTLMPIITSLPFMFDHPYAPMNMEPFIDVILGRGDFARQIALNILMTVPFGFLFPLTRKGNGSFVRTVLCCFLTSLCIELLQPLISGSRSADITDILTNVSGGIIGYILYLVFRPAATWFLSRVASRDAH